MGTWQILYTFLMTYSSFLSFKSLQVHDIEVSNLVVTDVLSKEL